MNSNGLKEHHGLQCNADWSCKDSLWVSRYDCMDMIFAEILRLSEHYDLFWSFASSTSVEDGFSDVNTVNE
ncbi:hypothetical protein CsSME_00042488 [Camellia sinensis var. sinensis]